MLEALEEMKPERQLERFVATVCGRRGCRVTQRVDSSRLGWRVSHNDAERLFTEVLAAQSDGEPVRSIIAWIESLHEQENDEAHP